MSSNFLRSGRLTFAEEHELRSLVMQGLSVRDVAQRMRRSEETISKKMIEMNLAAAAVRAPTRQQLQKSTEASRSRGRANRFRELAALEPDSYISGRLIALAREHDDIAASQQSMSDSPGNSGL